MKLYVYALVDRALASARVGGHAIATIAVGGLHAAVERRDQVPAVTEQSLYEQHEIVCALARRAPAILPARFGALVDRTELETIVSRRHDQLLAALALVRGREQMTVRLIGNEPQAGGRRRLLAAAAGPGTRYLDERRAAAGYPLPAGVERLNAAVRGFAVASKAEPGQSDVRAVLYHLIKRGSSARYCRALAEASAGAGPYVLRVSGPSPPFAFTPELIG